MPLWWYCVHTQAGCAMAVIHCGGHYFLISLSSRFLSLLPEETLALKGNVQCCLAKSAHQIQTVKEGDVQVVIDLTLVHIIIFLINGVHINSTYTGDITMEWQEAWSLALSSCSFFMWTVDTIFAVFIYLGQKVHSSHSPCGPIWIDHTSN